MVKYLSREELFQGMYEKLHEVTGGKPDIPVVREQAFSIIEQTVKILVQLGDVSKEDEEDVCTCLQASWVRSIIEDRE